MSYDEIVQTMVKRKAQKGYTLAQLETKTGYSMFTLSRLFNGGSVRAVVLIDVCEALDIRLTASTHWGKKK